MELFCPDCTARYKVLCNGEYATEEEILCCPYCGCREVMGEYQDDPKTENEEEDE